MRWLTFLLSILAFWAAISDSSTNSLPHATPEIWLGAALVFAALALGTSSGVNT